MKTANLTIRGSIPGTITLELQGITGKVDHYIDSQLASELVDEPSTLGSLLPQEISRPLENWVRSDQEISILTIDVDKSTFYSLHWELLPRLLQIASFFVVRVRKNTNPIKTEAPKVTRFLAAGWWKGLSNEIPGILNELDELQTLTGERSIEAEILYAPTPEELLGAIHKIEPTILHLVPPAIQDNLVEPQLLINGEFTPRWFSLDKLSKVISQPELLDLVVLNACAGAAEVHGPSAARYLCQKFGVPVIGWTSVVKDQVAKDFALYLYNDLFNGTTVSDTLTSYIAFMNAQRMHGVKSSHVYPPDAFISRSDLLQTFTVWTPSVDSLSRPVVSIKKDNDSKERRTRGGNGTRRGYYDGLESRSPDPKPPEEKETLPTVKLHFEPQAWINPALLKNGFPVINSLSIATRDRFVAELVIECDSGKGNSVIRQTIEIQNDRQPVFVQAWQFPVLYELISPDITRRQINFTATCTKDGKILAQETRSSLWMGTSEWLDMVDKWHFIPAFVSPYSQGTLEVIIHSDQTLKGLISPTSQFSGYQLDDGNYTERQVEAIFNCLRDVFKLNYIDVPPLLVTAPGENAVKGQRVRTPEQVIERKHGTCHDLAILFASCLEHIGVYPLIILIKGHTFFGFWRNAGACAKYWKEETKNNQQIAREKNEGREWMIDNVDKLIKLVKEGAIIPVEATRVADKTATYRDAVREGKENLDKPMLFDVAIDVCRSRHTILPVI